MKSHVVFLGESCQQLGPEMWKALSQLRKIGWQALIFKKHIIYSQAVHFCSTLLVAFPPQALTRNVCAHTHVSKCQCGKGKSILHPYCKQTQFQLSSIVVKWNFTSCTPSSQWMFTPVVSVLYSSIWEVFRWLLVLVIKDFLLVLGQSPGSRSLLFSLQTET